MKILTNSKIRTLFYTIGICVSVFILISAACIGFLPKHAALFVFVSALCMVLAIAAACYGYFYEQNKIIENAAAQITEYIAGNQNARIACDNEGELYKLFHKIDSLAAILSAHAENEGKAKAFLKDTISDISHQLKTPIAALNIYNGIIQEESEDLSTIREFSVLSEQELDRIETLVQMLLKITKFDAGTMVIDKKPENVAEMMEQVKKRFSFRAGQEGKEIRLAGSEDIMLLCDRSLLTEAVDNIVKNALDHTKEGDCVCVEWNRFTSVVQITIKDNGSGIHSEDLYHIFKRFYRSRFSKDVQGIGLGLPLAKAIVEAHGGTIEVDSAFGRGAAFVINLLI